MCGSIVPPAARATSFSVPPRCPAVPWPPAEPAAIAAAATSAATTANPVTRLMLLSFRSEVHAPDAVRTGPDRSGCGHGGPARLARDASEPGARVQEERRRSG